MKDRAKQSSSQRVKAASKVIKFSGSSSSIAHPRLSPAVQLLNPTAIRAATPTLAIKLGRAPSNLQADVP
jgi:hypothetical protein